MSAFLAPTFGVGYQSFTNQGLVNAGGSIKTWVAGSTTPQPTWTDSTQVVSNGSTIVLDSSGRSPQAIWLQGGVAYKFQVFDATGVQVGPAYDNVSGVNDTVAAPAWQTVGGTPTYLAASVFSLPGDLSSVFFSGRRVRYTLASGMFYGTVGSPVVSGGSTTVGVTYDSTPLDNTISAVAVGNPTPGVEQGVWTPAVTLGGAAVGLVYDTTNTKGVWTRLWTPIGTIVFIEGRLKLTAKGSSTGSVVITGFPFNSVNGGINLAEWVIGMFDAAAMSSLADNVYGVISANSSTMGLFTFASTGRAALTNSAMTDTTDLQFNGWYKST